MSDALATRLLDALGLTLPDGVLLGTKEAEDGIVRRAKAIVETHRRSAERAQLWETRFSRLAQVAGQDAAKEAITDVPTAEKMQFLRWLDPTSQDFLGSGMTFQELFMREDIKRFRQSFAAQDRLEQDRRLSIVMRASGHYLTIRAFDTCGTALLEMAIREILMGQDPASFAEAAGWMIRNERPPFGDMTPDETQQHLDHEKHRLALWMDAVRVLCEYSDAFDPVGEAPAYDSWQAMLAAQDELSLLPSDLVIRTSDKESWERRWCFHLMHIPVSTFADLFEMGVRYAATDGLHGGCFYRVDRGPFPGLPYRRIFEHDPLLRWLFGQKERGRDANA